jgi:tetraacyldisaccharide 4'-kinase
VSRADVESSTLSHPKSSATTLRNATRLVASWIYGLGARAHRAVMGRTASRRGRLACAVVSVGGLTVGGAGKTPFAAHLAFRLHQRGWRVVLATRGYKGEGREPVSVVSDGSYIRSSVVQSGDEAFVLAAHAPGVPVLVGRDRRVVGHHAVSVFDAQILILDDGFQHHRLSRDLDLVCIDGSAGLGNGRVLPAGPLREPISALRHADWLCVIDGRGPEDESQPSLEAATIETFESGGREVVRARRAPRAIDSLDRSRSMPLEQLRGREVGLLSAVARPSAVRRTLVSLGARIIAERRFRDHHAYVPKDLANLDPTPDLWITTEKDAFKISPEWTGDTSLWVLRIEIEIDREKEVLDRLEARLRALGLLTPSRPRAGSDFKAPD